MTQKFIFVHPDLASVGDTAGGSEVRFYVSELRASAGVVRFTVESAGACVPQIAVHDVQGRRIRVLTNGRSTQGRREVTWDCRDEAGRSVAAGMYFARMTGAGRVQVVRVPIIR